MSATAEDKLRALERELEAALAAGEAVRVRENGGPENLAASVAVTMAKLRAQVERLERELEQQRKAAMAIYEAARNRT